MNTPITQLLLAWSDGNKEALDQLIPLVEHELHRLAARQMRREKPGHTIQTTALVHEAYFKLIDQKNVRWQNRAHFFAIAARLMRRILLDHAKSRGRDKRGGGTQRVTLDAELLPHKERGTDLIALDQALQELAEYDPRKSRIVEMKFFGGLSNEEIAEVEQVSTSTVEKEWRKARAWLLQAITE